jgi:ribosomal protein L37E
MSKEAIIPGESRQSRIVTGFLWVCILIYGLVLLPGPGFSKEGTPPPEGESEEDVAGSTPCIDNGKASRGHTRCVKCGHSKNPSARLQCTHCGAFLREQTKARVAQRWATLKEKAKQEGRLGDKVWNIPSTLILCLSQLQFESILISVRLLWAHR